MASEVRVIREPDAVSGDAALAESVSLLEAVASHAIREDRVIRLYAPLPTVAMSRRESRMPGFAQASRAAVERGFAPAIRPTGGRAVAYDESCVVFDVIDRSDGPAAPSDEFFADVARALTTALSGVGVDARVGAVPGEYCPGPFSVNARGRVKLIGTSQRAVRGARLLSGMLALGEVDHLVQVLVEANSALTLEWDPSTFGSMGSEAPGIDRVTIESALEEALRTMPRIVPAA